jgi:uncharacterized protein (TIGR02284 family)
MSNTEQALQDIARIARSGRDFFVDMGPRAKEREVQDAFTYVADVKERLINSLAIWTPTAPCGGHDRSTVAAVEKLYADIRPHFQSGGPARVAHALAVGEDQLLKLTERAFEGTRVPALRQLLKAYYSEISICHQAMSRLQTRLAA